MVGLVNYLQLIQRELKRWYWKMYRNIIPHKKWFCQFLPYQKPSPKAMIHVYTCISLSLCIQLYIHTITIINHHHTCINTQCKTVLCCFMFISGLSQIPNPAAARHPQVMTSKTLPKTCRKTPRAHLTLPWKYWRGMIWYNRIVSDRT